MKKRALLSVFDKTGVLEFARGLNNLGYEIVSTGGTFTALKDAGIPVVNISDITGFPECLDGRVKTLHPMVHAGILAMRGNPEHMKQIEMLGVTPIDVIAVNLYPFKKTILKEGVTLPEAIENIDIGGPTMIRASAKNWQDVAVLVDPADYDGVLKALESGGVTKEEKFRLAAKVFEHTAHYDALIASYLRKQFDTSLPDVFTATFEKAGELRYGENPHQKASYYREIGHFPGSVTEAVQLHGKELSYNNIADTDAAIGALKEFGDPCVVAVKHANPCGIGLGNDIFEAYRNAYEADPVSIFGGIIASNREIDGDTAAEINKIFIEIVIAPAFTDEALDILKSKKNIRILALPGISFSNTSDMLEYKKIRGGLLVQELDCGDFDPKNLTVVTKTAPSPEMMKQLLFAWKAVKHTKSNAIILAKDNHTVGVGPGQTNRITALELAIRYAGDKVKGSVMASDAFFPFPDCVEAAAKAGITAIIQPGGSINDDKSIAAADEAGIAMVFTGIRHFKH